MRKRVPEGSPQEEAPGEPLAKLLSGSARLGAPASAVGLPGPTLGRLCGFAPSGEPLVSAHGSSSGEPVQALSTVPVEAADVGRDAVLLWLEGGSRAPVIVGLLEAPARPESSSRAPSAEEGLSVDLDGRRIALTAEREIVLRCGKASITLTSAGKVLIKGAYVLSRSTGVNRIKGGSVQLN